MNLKKKLQNPFALVIEGFAMGAVLFFGIAYFNPEPQPPLQSAQSVPSFEKAGA